MDERRSPSPSSSSWTVPSPTPSSTQPQPHHPLPSLPLQPPPNSSHHSSHSSSPSSYPSQPQPPRSTRPPSLPSHSPPRMPPPPPPPNHQHRSSSTSSTATNSSTSHNKLPKFLRRDKDKDKDKRRGSADDTLEGNGAGGGGDGRHERMTGLQQQASSSSSGSRSSHLSPPLDSTSSFSNGPPSSYNSPPKKSKSKTLGRKGSKLFGTSSSSSIRDAPPPPPPSKDDDPSSLHRSVSPTSISTTSSSAAYNIPSDPMIIVEPPPPNSNSSNRRHLSSPAGLSSRRSTSVNLQTRPLSSVSSTNSNSHHSSPYSHPNNNGSTSRLGDIVASAIPTRLGGWLSNLLPAASSSSTSLAHSQNHTPIPPSLHQQQQQAVGSPPRPTPGQGQRSFVAAAKEKGAIMRYLLDSDAGKPEKCEEGIWVMGILHEGWRPPVSSVGSPTREREEGEVFSVNPISPPRKQMLQQQQRSSTSPASPGKFTNLFSSSTLSLSMGGGGNNHHLQEGSSSSSSPKRERESSSSKKKEKEEVRWPEEFFTDFSTSVWCTYRSQYAPITHLPPHLLVPSPTSYDADGLPLPSLVSESLEAMKRPPIARPSSGWAWVRGDEKGGLTTDSGWGCMLRTGQSLLANSLVRVHLGRDWRRPSTPPSESASSTPKEIEDYATYVRILSWFMDDPLPHAPFSVHRMALVGKQLGKEVGEWFGPSTAAGAIRTLTNGYPHAALSVALAADAVIFRSDVYAASQPPLDASEGRRSVKPSAKKWGGRAVLVLVGVRLGLDGVNPIYFESVKNLFTFPQSVGIAGGRPSSSYYFLGYQAESLFYLDPHHTRPAIVLKVPPTREELEEARATNVNSDAMEFEEEGISFASESEVDTVLGDSRRVSVLTATTSQPPSSSHQPQPRSSSLTRTLSPEEVPLPATLPLPTNSNAAFLTPTTPTSPLPPPPPSPSSKPAPPPPPPPPSSPLDPLLEWYATAYPQQSLQTFHCEKVRKMAFSQLDPSMLLGFLCRNEEEWDDFCARVADMPNAIFSIADEPSSWDDDDEAGLESFSETDPDGMSSHSATTDDPDAEDLYDDDDDEDLNNASRSRSRSHVGSPPLPALPPPTPHPPPPRQSTGSESLVVVDDEDLGVELILNKNSLDENEEAGGRGGGSSSEQSRSLLTPSTPTLESHHHQQHRPVPSRALGSEFELLEKDDWLEDDQDPDELDEDGLEVEHLVDPNPNEGARRNRNQPILSSASMSMRNKKSSLPFPSPSKEEEEEEFGLGTGVGEEERTRARTVGSSGGRRRMGGRATSGVTLNGLEEDGDDF